MRAAFINQPMSVLFTDVKEPQITKDNEVKIQVKVTGICGSEIHAFHGTHPYRIPPVVSGHEFAGDVVEVGAKVRKYKAGDRVTAEPQYGCGTCNFCNTGRYNICKNKVVLGSNKWSGSFGEYIVIPEDAVVSIPDTMSYEEAAMIEPLAVGMHLVKRSGLKAGQTAAIIGAGTIGLGILLCAELAGVKNLIVSDMIDYNLQTAKQLGASYCINPANENATEKINAYSAGTGIDIVYLAVDASAAFQMALNIVSPNGTIAAVTTPRNTEGCSLNQIIGKELKVVGSYMYVHEEFETIRDKIAGGDLNVRQLISRILPIEEAEKAMEIADKKTEDVIKVMMKF